LTNGPADADPYQFLTSSFGQWKGRVRIADDFDTLPDDIAIAFGIDPTDACQLSDLRNAWAEAPR
jgi:hypothetical protein